MIAPALLNEVIAELEAATAQHPSWPVDPIHAFAILGEEHGELNKALVEAIYEPWKANEISIHKEAVQVAATALRFLINFDRYRFKAP